MELFAVTYGVMLVAVFYGSSERQRQLALLTAWIVMLIPTAVTVLLALLTSRDR